MKKEALEVTYKVLEVTDLSLADARIRDAFIRELSNHIKAFYEDKQKIIETYGEKMDDGKFKIADTDKFQQEMQTLLEETVEIKPSDKIKEFINNTNYKPKIGEMAIIDEVLALS